MSWRGGGSGFVFAYHPVFPGSNPKHTIFAFIVKFWTIFVIVLRKNEWVEKETSFCYLILNQSLALQFLRPKNQLKIETIFCLTFFAQTKRRLVYCLLSCHFDLQFVSLSLSLSYLSECASLYNVLLLMLCLLLVRRSVFVTIKYLYQNVFHSCTYLKCIFVFFLSLLPCPHFLSYPLVFSYFRSIFLRLVLFVLLCVSVYR